MTLSDGGATIEVRRRTRLATEGILVGALAMALAGCTDFTLPDDATPPPMPLPTQTAAPVQDDSSLSTIPSPKPGVTADAASMSTANQRLESVIVPPGALASTSRPQGVASSLAVRMLCQPMADAKGYWTVPGSSLDTVVAFLTTHTPVGLTFEESTATNAVEGTDGDATVIEFSASKDVQNGLIYEVTSVDGGAGIRADSLVVPSNATCATASPGMGYAPWGG
ncbi:hypothetical protein ACX9R5_13875 [Rathayibacter sp. CAU 1779]